jgi:hypothetical protein
MKLVAAVLMVALLLIPAVASAGAEDAALALGAFAVFNQLISGTGLFGSVAPVVVAPQPVYAPPPVVVAPRPVYVPPPIIVAPRPVYVAPPVAVAPPPVYVYRHPGHHRAHGHHWARHHDRDRRYARRR